MNAASAQVHAVFWGKDAFGRFEVHDPMELLKSIIRQAGFTVKYIFLFPLAEAKRTQRTTPD